MGQLQVHRWSNIACMHVAYKIGGDDGCGHDGYPSGYESELILGRCSSYKVTMFTIVVLGMSTKTMMKTMFVLKTPGASCNSNAMVVQLIEGILGLDPLLFGHCVLGGRGCVMKEITCFFNKGMKQ